MPLRSSMQPRTIIPSIRPVMASQKVTANFNFFPPFNSFWSRALSWLVVSAVSVALLQHILQLGQQTQTMALFLHLFVLFETASQLGSDVTLERCILHSPLYRLICQSHCQLCNTSHPSMNCLHPFFGDSRRHHLTKIHIGRRQNARSAVMILLARRWSVSSHPRWVAFHWPESQIIGHETSVAALLKAKSSYWRFV